MNTHLKLNKTEWGEQMRKNIQLIGHLASGYSLCINLGAKWRAHFNGYVAIGRGQGVALDVGDNKRWHAQHYGKHPDNHGRKDSQRLCLCASKSEEKKQ